VKKTCRAIRAIREHLPKGLWIFSFSFIY
jgi:hypothetical protein